jgi:hypothetical protein
MYLSGWGVGRGGAVAVNAGVLSGDVKGGRGVDVDVLVAPSCASTVGSGTPPDVVQASQRGQR